MKLIAIKTENGTISGEISFYCRVLKVSRQGFYKYLKSFKKPWKYESLAAEMENIKNEDECNDTYGYVRMYQALKLKKEENPEKSWILPCERTVYRIMQNMGMIHKPKRKPNSLTKADKKAQKSDDLLERDFKSEVPLKKCVTDITELKTADGKLYISALEDCFDDAVLGLSMENHMRAELCENTIKNAIISFPDLSGAIVHSDRGSQYTSTLYRETLKKHGITQSMNSAAGRCHDNAKCESLWGRFKEELVYGRYNTEKMPMDEVKSLVWRYFMSYWNNRRICSANNGLPPMVKRKKFYEKIYKLAA